MLHVPNSVRRLAIEIDGWLEWQRPDIALEKLDDLFAVPGARPVALMLRTRAYIALERFAEAIPDIEESRSFDHDPEESDLKEAWCRKRMNDIEGAAECMRRLLARTNHSAIGHFNLGCYLALMGDKDAALDEITLACGIDPEFRSHLDDDDLQSLHGLPDFEKLKDG